MKMSKRKVSEDAEQPAEKKAKVSSDKPVIHLRAVNVTQGKGHVAPGKSKKKQAATDTSLPKDFCQWNAMPHNIYCGRWAWPTKMASPYRNPFLIKKGSKDPAAERKRVIQKFEAHMTKNHLALKLQTELVRRLQENPSMTTISLGCWCKPEPCHVDQLIERVCAMPCEQCVFQS
jgi:hypothetical protein